MNRIIIIVLIIMSFSACEENRMENYRVDFSGDFLFHTIVGNENGALDTVKFSGSIEPVYSNLTNIVEIHFIPELSIDPVLKENGQLANNAWWSGQGIPVSVAGSFRNNKQNIVFSYLVGSAQNYIIYQVSGQRLN